METAQGSVPISNFVERKAERTVGILNRIDGERTIVVQANVAAGMQVAAVQQQVTQAISEMDLGSGTRWKLAGSNEDSAEASAFLSKAFGAAIFLIFLVLLAQFNKFTSVWLVLSCVVMATIGVFLGLLLTGQAFGIVMSGIGVIALAGVVVNNNIVLIDTYDRLREEGWDKMEAVLQTCRERARPVVLTAVSAILGVLPIAFGLGLEIFHQETTINAPSTQWWISLSSAIVFGLSFATVLTLVVTPSMLMVFTRAHRKVGRRSWLSRLFGLFRRGKLVDEPAKAARRRARRARSRLPQGRRIDSGVPVVLTFQPGVLLSVSTLRRAIAAKSSRRSTEIRWPASVTARSRLQVSAPDPAPASSTRAPGKMSARHQDLGRVLGVDHRGPARHRHGELVEQRPQREERGAAHRVHDQPFRSVDQLVVLTAPLVVWNARRLPARSSAAGPWDRSA